MKRLSLAFRCFFSLLFKGTVSQTLLGELRERLAQPKTGETVTAPGAPARQDVAETGREAAVPDRAERAVQMLALLQRDARLVDFVEEDIAGYDDAQVGAAVRDLHASCRETLNRYVTLEPVLDGEEGKPITVEAGFEPGTIKLIGNVTGRLPARGILRHHGWRAGSVRLPDLPAGATRSVIAPAEVELS